MEKENVLMEKFTKLEQAETKDRGRYETNAEKGSVGLGKFKDENALLNAYGALEAEFTRRSQRLKELERTLTRLQEKAEKPKDADEKQNELSKAGIVQADEKALSTDGISAVEPVAVVTDGDGKQSSTQASAVTGDTPFERGSDEAETTVRGSEKASVDFGLQTDGRFSRREIDLPIESEKTKERALPEEELYQKAVNNESVRLKIIGEYLASLGRSDAPLMRGGFGTFATPPVKARTISEAGNLALSFLKK